MVKLVKESAVCGRQMQKILALVRRINITASIESPQIDCVEKWSRESGFLKFMK